MGWQSFLVGLALAGALLPLLASWCRGRSRGAALGAVGLWLVLPAAIAFQPSAFRAGPGPTEREVVDRPIEDPVDGYVTSRTCRACHPQQYSSWHDSYHRRMTQVASPDAVLGPFDGREVELLGRTYRFEREGDDFVVEMDDPTFDRKEAERLAQDPQWRFVDTEPPRVRKRIVLTSGSHNKQILWYPTGDTRVLGQLPVYWLPKEQRWIPRSAGFLSDPHTPHPDETRRWNHTCIRCHTTHGRGLVDDRNTMDSRVAEFGIACESCHGPGEEHVRVNRDPRRRYRSHFSDEPDPTIVNPSRLPHDRASEICAQCHGLWEFYTPDDALDWSAGGFPYRPGDALADTRLVVRYESPPSHPRIAGFLEDAPLYMENRFWSDGVVRTAGREYNGLIESPCFEEGELSCLSCHAMHTTADDPRPVEEWAVDQLSPAMDGPAACLQCHGEYARDVSAHTHHEPDSPGSDCYNCHMSHTGYGLLKAVRSHVIESPSVATSLATGRPNACNQCHLDRTLAWSAEHLASWYGQPVPELDDDERDVAASLLWLLSGDAQQRVLMAWSYGWAPAQHASGTKWMAPFLGQLLQDPYDVVRFIAHRSLQRVDGFAELAYDFLGSDDERRAATLRVLERWRPDGLDRPDALLIDPLGGVRRDELERLLRLRDDRSIHLQE